MKHPRNLSEALSLGYTLGDHVIHLGYTSRKVSVELQPIHVAGGKRSGQLYVELPNRMSTRFGTIRQYLIPPEDGDN